MSSTGCAMASSYTARARSDSPSDRSRSANLQVKVDMTHVLDNAATDTSCGLPGDDFVPFENLATRTSTHRLLCKPAQMSSKGTHPPGANVRPSHLPQAAQLLALASQHE